jgi:hypothetical protein
MAGKVILKQEVSGMRIKLSKKHICICMLVCSLFLACYPGLFISNGIISSDGYALNSSSFSGGVEHSSMNGGGANLWHTNYFAITNISTEIFTSSIKHSEWLLKLIFSILTSFITAQIICLIYSSRLAGSLCSQFNSIGITLFLHKKDGMK